MASYQTFTTLRGTAPDPVALTTAARSATSDSTTVVLRDVDGTYRGKKATPWTPPQIAATQTALDTVAPLTDQLVAQRAVDSWPIEYRALVLALIDQLNVIRAALPVPLGGITPTQAIAAIRTKAGTL